MKKGSHVLISRRKALWRTKKMLQQEWRLDDEPLADTKLCACPPHGLGKKPVQIRALETPIEAVHFADVKANVAGHVLATAEDVGALRDKIWIGIPQEYKVENRKLC